MAMEKREIAETLCRLRIDRKLKSSDVAYAIGVSRESIWHWEQGRYLPGMEILFKLCEYYNVSIDETFDLKITKSTAKGATSTSNNTHYKYTVIASGSRR